MPPCHPICFWLEIVQQDELEENYDGEQDQDENSYDSDNEIEMNYDNNGNEYI